MKRKTWLISNYEGDIIESIGFDEAETEDDALDEYNNNLIVELIDNDKLPKKWQK